MKALILDFDGVIVDSFPDQFKWFKHICSVLKKPFQYHSIEQFREDYLEPVYPNMYTFMGFNWEQEKEVIWSEYNQYKARATIGICSGIEEVIRKCRQREIDLAIASSNTNQAIDKQLQNHGLESYFKVIVGKEQLPVEKGEPLLKPHPACLLLALQQLGCSPSETVYVGDQPSDILAAKNVSQHRGESIPIIAVTYGYSTRSKLLAFQPEMIIDHPLELLNIIR